MHWVIELINIIPEVIKYVGPGFLLINAFMWINQLKFPSPTTQIVSSIVVSAIELSLWNMQKVISADENTTFVLLCVFSLIIGTLIGMLYKKQWFNNLLGFMRIHRTTTDSIWDDVVDENSWVCVYDNDSKIYYCGKFHYCNNSGEKTMVSLIYYYTAIKDGKEFKIKDNYLTDKTRHLVLDINEYKNIIVSKTDPLCLAVDK